MNTLDRENAKGGVKVKIEIEWEIQLDKHTILQHVPCGHLALGTLLETCFKGAAFEVKARQQQLTKMAQP